MQLIDTGLPYPLGMRDPLIVMNLPSFRQYPLCSFSSIVDCHDSLRTYLEANMA